MSRSPQLRSLLRLARIARRCDRHGLASRQGLERAAAAEAARRLDRRRFLAGAGRVALGGALAAGSVPRARAQRGGAAPRVAIVGAGLAGLTCADRLQSRGITPMVFDAHPARLGGRCFSLRGFFPGQVAENGGEFIDTGHKTMLGFANRFKLAVEDLEKFPGESAFHFFGQHHSEEAVVEEYRALVPRMRADLQGSSGSPTFRNHNAADIVLDHTDLATYLATRAADLPLIRAALSEAYVSEYGLEPHQQSCLNLLLFLHLDRRSRFLPFGVFSDERYHLVDGNDAIVAGLHAGLGAPVEMGRALERLSRTAAGEYRLKFRGSRTVRAADLVVLAIPFTTLREVELDASLGLSEDKRRAIAELGYGNNAKTMVGFQGRPWFTLHGGAGDALSDLANVQNTWETNPSRAGATAVLTDYAGGDRGAGLAARPVQAQVEAFLTDLDQVFPGAKAHATRLGGAYLAHREHWPSNPLVKGSYTCYLPGQFTGLAGLEGEPAGGLKFAGEHADSFYSWQGFMEGACLSGLRAAAEVLADT